MKRGILIATLCVLLLIPTISAQVVVNSQDWRDVFTGLQYAAATNQPGAFVTSTEQSTALLGQLDVQQEITLITGRQQQAPGFRSLLQSRGYQIDAYSSVDAIETNQEFVLRAPTRNLVIIDDAYGYNAISVANYANMRNASVVFADADIASIVEEKNPQEVLLYGHIETQRYQTLSSLATEEINNQDRFEDNFALVERFLSYEQVESFILSNGEFIEQQLITDEFPVLFTGRESVPAEVINFIDDNDFRIATLIGNSLAPNAEQIKQSTGISIFIKFAQGRNQQQVPLDLFTVPSPQPQIAASQATYNPATQTLTVTYQNPGDIATYFTAAISTDEETYEDQNPIFIESGTYKTIQYSMPSPGEQITYTILYGSGPTSLELVTQGNLQVDEVIIQDDSTIEIGEVLYDQTNQQLRVEIQNTGSQAVYVNLEAIDLRIGPQRVRIGSQIMRIAPGSTRYVELDILIPQEDLERNRDVQIEAFYGAKELTLAKSLRVTRPITVSSSLPAWVYLSAGAAIILVLLLVGMRRRKR